MKQWSKRKGYDVFICMIIIALSLLYNNRQVFLTSRSDFETVDQQELTSFYAGLFFFGFAFWNFLITNDKKRYATIFVVAYSGMTLLAWMMFIFDSTTNLITNIQPLGILGLLLVIGLVRLCCKR